MIRQGKVDTEKVEEKASYLRGGNLEVEVTLDDVDVQFPSRRGEENSLINFELFHGTFEPF